LIPVPTTILREEPLEEALNADPEKDEVENAAAEPRVARQASESFMLT